jgi:hypothetical protein
MDKSKSLYHLRKGHTYLQETIQIYKNKLNLAYLVTDILSIINLPKYWDLISGFGLVVSCPD